MAKYVKNPGGGIHSVPDDFEAPAEWGDDWSEITEEQARAEHAPLFGEPDPAVAQAELHDGGTDIPVTEAVTAPAAVEAVETPAGDTVTVEVQA